MPSNLDVGSDGIVEKKNEQKLFYYLHPEELIPEDHTLRLIDQYVDFLCTTESRAPLQRYGATVR